MPVWTRFLACIVLGALCLMLGYLLVAYLLAPERADFGRAALEFATTSQFGTYALTCLALAVLALVLGRFAGALGAAGHPAAGAVAAACLVGFGFAIHWALARSATVWAAAQLLVAQMPELLWFMAPLALAGGMMHLLWQRL